MSSDIYGSQFESILQSLEQMETALQKEIDKDVAWSGFVGRVF